MRSKKIVFFFPAFSSQEATAPLGILADSLTKVVSVLGPERGFAIVEKLDGVSALMIRNTDKGEEALASKRFPNSSFSREP